MDHRKSSLLALRHGCVSWNRNVSKYVASYNMQLRSSCNLLIKFPSIIKTDLNRNRQKNGLMCVGMTKQSMQILIVWQNKINV